jgi:hypothetical protein
LFLLASEGWDVALTEFIAADGMEVIESDQITSTSIENCLCGMIRLTALDPFLE